MANGPIHTEARCNTCGETFIVTGEESNSEHPEHYVCEDGIECGGIGDVTGSWVPTG